MPDRHRGAALRLAWARHQRQAGRGVWHTPSIHTWDAWLTRQWRDAAQRGATPSAQLLDPSQERAVWERVLAGLAAADEEAASLTQHAGAMMQSAARATQAQMVLARSAESREETLLVDALAGVRRECGARGWLSLRLAPAEALDFLADVAPPLVTGTAALTALQSSLARRHWPAASLLARDSGAASSSLPDPGRGTATGSPQCLRTRDLAQEIAACAQWCRAHVERDPAARLLVLSASVEPSLEIQAALLWRELAPDAVADDALRERWLAVEGGEPLLHQALFADALATLEMAAADQVELERLLMLLRSPYAGFGDTAATANLARRLQAAGVARWRRAGLLQLTESLVDVKPVADALVAWFSAAGEALPADTRLGATEWAQRFVRVLELAGFAAGGDLDSREIQRLGRWHELLDELAGLDAVLPAMDRDAALGRLRALAARSRHQAATGDAAVTLSASLGDPVVRYHGIWVMGMSETRWPPPPRPDAWIALAEQRRAGWPEAGTTARRTQAQWAQARWLQRAGELVLSFAAHEGEVEHRPTTLADAGGWSESLALPAMPAIGQGREDHDQQFMPLTHAQTARALPGGAGRLALQQACPFRAQAEWRLGARPPEPVSAGVPLSLRGRLLHTLLQQLWRSLRGQQALLALEPRAEAALLERCWQAALAATPQAQWIAPAVITREHARTLRLAGALLQLERERVPFEVEHTELPALWRGAGASLSLRVDRVDHVGGEAVLIDYKSGAPATIHLHKGEVQPLQLAVYAAALAQQGIAVTAAALLTLHPATPSFAGVARHGALLPRSVKLLEEWAQSVQHWQQQLEVLMEQHLSGAATLTRDRQVCTRCHLPALCRRAGADEDTGDEDPLAHA